MAENSSKRPLVVGAVVGVLVVFVLWGFLLIVTGLLAQRAADDAQAAAKQAANALRAGDQAAATSALNRLQDSASSVDSLLGSPPWQLAEGTPFIGPTVRTLTGIAAGTNALALATVGQEDVIAATAETLKTQGTAGISALSNLEPVTSAAVAGVRGPAEEVAAIPESDILAPLRGLVGERRAQFLELAEGATTAEAAVRAFPTMLGADGPRRWAVVMQNTAEPRGTGGLISAYATMDVTNGKFSEPKSDTTNDIDDKPVSLAGIPEDTRKLWGTDLKYSWGWNLDRHFPYAGLLAQRGISAHVRPVDDVLAVDADVVAQMMRITGPVAYRGIRVTPDNAAAFFTRDIYAKVPDPDKKDAITVALMTLVMDRFFGKDLDPAELWRVLGQPARDGHLLLYSGDPGAQEALEGSELGGAVPADPDSGPWASVVVNDNSGNKMGPYLDVSADWATAAACSAPGAESTIAVTVTNRAPKDLPRYVDLGATSTDRPAGSVKLGLGVYAPGGSAFRGADLAGNSDVVAGVDRDHPVWLAPMEILRGETKTFTVRFEEPRTTAGPVFAPQPMANPMAVSVAPAPC